MKIIKKIWKIFKSTYVYKNLFKISVILGLLAILIPLHIDRQNAKEDLERRRQIVYAENAYNMALLNTFKKAIKNEELNHKLFFNNFSLNAYREHWDIIANLESKCANAQVFAIAKMEAINSINEYILTLYNQEGLIFTTNQWKNTEGRKNRWYETLEENVLELQKYFDEMDGCQFR